MDFVFLLSSVLLGAGLAMDAFSVSLANGFHEPGMGWKKSVLWRALLHFSSGLCLWRDGSVCISLWRYSNSLRPISHGLLVFFFALSA